MCKGMDSDCSRPTPPSQILVQLHQLSRQSYCESLHPHHYKSSTPFCTNMKPRWIRRAKISSIRLLAKIPRNRDGIVTIGSQPIHWLSLVDVVAAQSGPTNSQTEGAATWRIGTSNIIPRPNTYVSITSAAVLNIRVSGTKLAALSALQASVRPAMGSSSTCRSASSRGISCLFRGKNLVSGPSSLEICRATGRTSLANPCGGKQRATDKMAKLSGGQSLSMST